MAAKPAPQGTWVQLTPETAFSPRDTAEDAVFLDRMWISNAYYHGNVLTRDLWNSADGITWTQISDSTPYDGYSELVVYQDKLWAVKGSVWNSADGIHWTQVLEKTPFAQTGYGELLVHDDKMWQVGPGSQIWHSSDGVEWTCVTDGAPYGDRGAAAVTHYNGRFWVLGGRIESRNDPPEKGYDTMTTYNDVWSSPDGINWTCVLEQAPWIPRMWFIASPYAGRLWIIGGYDNVNYKNFSEVWYTEDGVEWNEFVSEPVFAPRHEPTVYIFDGSLWVVAGNTWPVVNDVWRLTLEG
ncbi:MAG: hypothetical protein GKR89_14690 [Candidatus Latescibacteria bacterium]|nr:hypothetical protein [Candidatus Latescibacterota bacterium]